MILLTKSTTGKIILITIRSWQKLYGGKKNRSEREGCMICCLTVLKSNRSILVTCKVLFMDHILFLLRIYSLQLNNAENNFNNKGNKCNKNKNKSSKKKRKKQEQSLKREKEKSRKRILKRL